MAQQISKEEYERQSSEYTKKALAELNEQLKNFRRKEVEENAEEYLNESSEEESDYSPRKNRKRIVIETDILEKSKAKKTKRHDIDHSIVFQLEQRIRDLETELKSEESKNHYRTLDLSNAECKLEVVKEKLKKTENDYSQILNIRLKLILYLVFVNVFIMSVWYSVPIVDKIVLTPIASFSLYVSWAFKNFFYKFKKL